MKVTTIGVFPKILNTEALVNELRAAGINDEEISIIYSDREGALHDEQGGEKVESGTVAGATTGAVLGALAGLAVANGVLPGLGTIFVAGPLLLNSFGFSAVAATTLGGALTGTFAGGLVGGLVKFGIAEEDAKIYENLLAEGDVVVITRTDSPFAKSILEKNNADQVKEFIGE